jgi:L-threonylcarbamoyladenylate synthase
MYTDLAGFLEHLNLGGCGVYPTDTVPGLGCLPQHVEQLYRYKNRAQNKPIILLAADLEQVRNLCAYWNEAWNPVVTRYWPGALTLPEATSSSS